MIHTKLFLAGPTEVSDEMFQAMSHPMIGHRSKDYQALHESVVKKLRRFIGTTHEIFIFTSSATGVMEAAVRNCVRGKILHTVCGAFSERWVDISRACGKVVETVDVPFGKAVRPELVASELASDSIGGRQAATLQLPRDDGYRFDAVAITHNETSSGVMNPLNDLCETVRRVQPDALIFVDAVSSFGGSIIKPDEWGIDVLIFGTQKCLALPPGLAFAVVSPRAMVRSQEMTDKGYYFDFIEMKKYADKNMTPATPAISLLFGVDAQLDRMLAEGMEGRAVRHQDMAMLAQEWVARHHLPFTAEEGFRSPTVTSISVPEGFNSDEFRKKVKEKGYALADGYGKLKGKGFRIGHMGDWKVEDVGELLRVMDKVINSSSKK
ncbi:MAG: alanine--glyoxylate aminotransferase family protein [Patescibacteria group bacterium]